ncbi:MAG: S1 RNA-binding domain-containing protein [Patescibacteria group bacterium]|jgi:small subunit ribosomal protein S1
MVNKPNTEETMEELVTEAGENLVPFKVGSVADVVVTAVTKNSIWVDVAGVAVGIIPDREFSFGTGDLKVGDHVVAYVLSQEDKEGHVVLSLRKADRERLWVTLKDKFESGEVLQAKVAEANKGGLMVEIGGVVGFLPISQLASNHYPRATQGNRDEVSTKLNELIGETMNVKIINFDKITNKLIFSERAAGDTVAEEKLSKIKIGEILKGKITGIVDFGLFVSIGDDLEGLVHISEISWKRVSDLRTMFNIGDEINVSVTGITDGKVSLSMKRLLEDPWVEAASKFKVGDIVSGVVTGATRFGVFVRLNDTVDGLVHKSELTDENVEDPSTILPIGHKDQFRVISIDSPAHRLSLSWKGLKAEADKQAAKTAKKLPEKAEVQEEVKEEVKKESPKKAPAKKPAAKKTSKKE